MQLVSVGIFSNDGKRRDVNFKVGELNILTGKSKTGKSAILDIVDFCLGRDSFTIAAGIARNVSWYYLIVEIGLERILLCRPNPKGASTNRAMIKIGDLTLEPPEFDQLDINADTDVVRDALTERLGIESYTIEPEAGSLRTAFDVSVRQSLFYCFQQQNEIGNQDILFHRQIDNDVKSTIRYTLPYFLGAATPEQAAVFRQLVSARRTLRRLQLALQGAEADANERSSRVSNLVRSAVSLKILPDDSGVSEPTTEVLRQILDYVLVSSNGLDHDLQERRTTLDQDLRTIRTRIRELDDRIELLTRLQAELVDSGEESDIQRDRLRAIDVMLPNGSEDNDTSVCPVCDQSLPEPDETIEELQRVLKALEQRIAISRGSHVRREAAIGGLRDDRASLIESLHEASTEREIIGQQETAVEEGRQLRERVAFLQGRVSQELERGIELTSGLGDLREQERRARGQLARLEQLYEQDDPAASLRAAIDSIADLMTDYARFLRLESSQYVVRLDPVELTVVIQEPGGRVPLRRMGSAENWVGYHLVAHLALHHWFVTEGRPVPRFVMFDQPTQAFFPEEVVDSAEDENADWEAVRRQFTLMRDVVQALDGQLQVVVCDHANLADEWFQDALIDNWRNGIALIPTDWLDEA
jgi:hypothetical protein